MTADSRAADAAPCVDPATPRQQIVALFWKLNELGRTPGDGVPITMLDLLSVLMDELDGSIKGEPSPMRPIDGLAAPYPIAKDWAVVTEVKAFMGVAGRRARVKASHWSPEVSRDKILEGDLSVFFDVAECDAPRVGQSLCVPIFGYTVDIATDHP